MRRLDPRYRALGAAVVMQAYRDARRGDPEAAAFLTAGGSSLAFWCDVADVDPVVIQERASRMPAARRLVRTELRQAREARRIARAERRRARLERGSYNRLSGLRSGARPGGSISSPALPFA